MAITGDFHIHTSFSADSEAPMEDMVKSAIDKGLKHICFTEHMDLGFPQSPDWDEHAWEVNVDSYLYQLLQLRPKYEDKIQLGFGIELGLQEQVFRENAITARSHEFDFIIGSIHLVNGIDPYLPVYYEGITEKEAFEKYFKATLSNIKKFQNFDVLGHLDYAVRYAPNKEANYNPLDYMDIIDEIFELLIENEKGIEINTSALVKGLNNPNPNPAFIKRYKELGGEIITIGSDAHNPENIAAYFDIAQQILTDCGFKYYTTFDQRVAHYNKII